MLWLFTELEGKKLLVDHSKLRGWKFNLEIICDFYSAPLCNVHFSYFSISLQTQVHLNTEASVYCIVLYMNVLYTTCKMSICTI